jgi:hypothetical protein
MPSDPDARPASVPDIAQIEAILAACERALERDGRLDLRRLSFWRAVGAIKRERTLIERYADRVGAIDRRAFEQAVSPTLPMPLGTAILGAGAATGVAIVGAACILQRRWRGVTVLAGTAVLLGTTHDLAHLVVGQLVGIRFTHWFVDGPTRLQPGLKTDYASYLRTPPRARAWMHASGAVVTKTIPFAVLALRSGDPPWARWALVAIGGVQILTDVFFSRHHADWKRFFREMAVARAVKPRGS